MTASPSSPITTGVGRAAAPVARPRSVPVVTRNSASGAVVDLLAAIPQPTGALSLVCEGDGVVGWGCYDRLTVRGPDAAQQIAQWWSAVCATFAVTDDVALAGSGPILFVSLGFGPDDDSVAIIPRAVLGSRDGRRFTTVIGDQHGDLLRPPIPMQPPGAVRYQDELGSSRRYEAAVAAAVQRLRAGDLDKVVLAQEISAVAEGPIDQRYLLTRLAAAYPSCWTFAIDGLVGASPELLVRRHGRRVASRVLAGTAWPERAGEHTAGVVATHLLASGKDVLEHQYAVDSVVQVLRELTVDVRVPRTPRALPLANLTHLVTDISVRLPAHQPLGVDSQASALAIAARLHPTAAVGGSPRAAALSLIAELEPLARGRYAAPIGWVDAAGDGEFALALRCAQVEGHVARLTAGCGVMADSDPAVEAREAQVKMLPIRDALS